MPKKLLAFYSLVILVFRLFSLIAVARPSGVTGEVPLEGDV